MQKRSKPVRQHLGAKRLRQQQLGRRGASSLDSSGSDKRQEQRFWPCPVCNRSFALFRLDEHVNQCLGTAPCTTPTSPSSPLTTKQDVTRKPSAVQLFPPSIRGSGDERGASHDVQTSPSSVAISGLPEESRISPKGDFMQHPLTEIVGGFPLEKNGLKFELRCNLTYLGCNPPHSHTKSANSSVANRRTGEDGHDPEENGMAELDGKHGTREAEDRPPAGFRLFQRQVQSQARLSMFSNFSSATLQRKPSVTVLQPGMVLFRSWLDLDTQQKFVQESQSVSQLFRRPITPGGGKYHVYSMCWGSQWDAKARRYVAKGPEHPIPPWLFELSQKLAQDAQQHTSVYPVDSTYAPDVGLVNFYPVKADELGVIGLGGHQDLDDSGLMPVVSVSIGDSMTFFYRRFPPYSRRKSGISIRIDEEALRSCEDGDAAHNREQQILLESGDVLVFGGRSRLIYHGTRHVQAGTRPPGLHMVPGRLNFTFRQTVVEATM